MRAEECFDRKLESDIIDNHIAASLGSLVVVISAPTGVGKSALAKRTIRHHRNGYACICAKTNQTNESRQVDEGKFLSAIFLAICKAHENDDSVAFHAYVMGIKDKSARKRTIGKIIDLAEGGGLKRAVYGVVASLFRRAFKLVNFDYRHIAEKNDLDSKRLMGDYVSFALSKRRTLLYVDGLQNIDDYSKGLLAQWIRDTSEMNNLFLLEYTLVDEAAGATVERFESLLRSERSQVCPVRLQRLSYEDALLAAADEATARIVEDTAEARRFYNNDSGGNVWKLRDFFRAKQFTECGETQSKSSDPTVALIGRLQSDAKAILALMQLHEGNMAIDTIEGIFDGFIGPNRINGCIADLAAPQYEFVRIESERCLINHSSMLDSVLDELRQEQAIRHVVYEKTALYYTAIMKDGNASAAAIDQAALFLISLFDEFDKNKLRNMIGDLKRLAGESIGSNRAAAYAGKIIESVRYSKEAFVDLYYDIIELCISLESYDDALNYLDELTNVVGKTAKFRYFRTHLLIAAEQYGHALSYIDEICSDYENTHMGTYLLLFRILATKLQHRSVDTSAIASEAKARIDSCGSEIQRSYLLWLSEISKPRDLALHDLLKCVLSLEQQGLELQLAKARLSLGFLYAIRGDYREAFSQYDKAENVLGRRAQYSYMFQVNSSALYLLSGLCNRNVWRLLNDAELTARTDTARVAILINKMAYCLEMSDLDRGKDVAARLESIASCRIDAQFKAIAYYNLYLHYTQTNETSKAAIAFSDASSLRSECYTLDCRLAGRTPKDGTDGLIRHPWHVCFLSYLNLDYLETEESLASAIPTSAPIISA